MKNSYTNKQKIEYFKQLIAYKTARQVILDHEIRKLEKVVNRLKGSGAETAPPKGANNPNTEE